MKTTIKILSLIIALVCISSCSKSDDGSQLDPTLVTIPDANFEQALVDLGIDTNGLNGNIFRTDAEAVQFLNVSNKNISNLQGIEAFVNLLSLTFNNNEIANVDLSENLILEDIECRGNLLTNFDVSNNRALRMLHIPNNQLTSVDVSNNPLLFYLAFDNNQVSSIDVINNTLLQYLYCSGNLLTTIDLTSNNLMTAIFVRGNQLETLKIKNGNNSNVTIFSAVDNINLTCIEVDDTLYSYSNWNDDIDIHTDFNTDCN